MTCVRRRIPPRPAEENPPKLAEESVPWPRYISSCYHDNKWRCYRHSKIFLMYLYHHTKKTVQIHGNTFGEFSQLWLFAAVCHFWQTCIFSNWFAKHHGIGKCNTNKYSSHNFQNCKNSKNRSIGIASLWKPLHITMFIYKRHQVIQKERFPLTFCFLKGITLLNYKVI